jgi:hypothetical protein
MNWSNLDTLCRQHLLQRGLPLHYYVESLTHAAEALRELTLIKLQVIKTVRIPLNDYWAGALPHDFVDDVAVCLPVGQQLKPLVKDDTLTPLRNRNASGAFVPRGTSEVSTVAGVTGYWFFGTNEWGEHPGKMFGVSGGSSVGYKIVRERRQIQLSENYPYAEIVLQYISDGQSADAATQVDVRAARAITTFIDWQEGPNAKAKDAPEARTFYNELRLLGTKLNPLTLTDIRNIIHSATHASIKG